MAPTPDLAEEAAVVRRAARRLLTAAEVDAAMRRMAEEIAARLQKANPVVVAVMHGGVFTAVELCRRFDFPYEFAYVHVSRYGRELTGGDLEWHVEPRPSLAGRTILLVDDVLDGGVTLAAIERSVRALGVGEVFKAVFVVKDFERPRSRPAVDFVGVHVDDVYVFGCGMDYKGYWRGWPELLALAQEPELRASGRDAARGARDAP
ncbi:MAG TPA: hypoxanthine-guanine phosphoribosyltransferase [Gammaproteobacteria bacterium]|nr:hypoxanthine-guanine phosphoribosyltransferase [Gammaproteobacteria bacterium]